MSQSIYSLLKAKFLINDDAFKNWKFIVFLLILAMIAITNNHWYDAKNYKITELADKVKELRSEFVDKRSELMKLKMESTISKKVEERGIYPASVPPVKIIVKQEKKKENSFLEKLKVWQ